MDHPKLCHNAAAMLAPRRFTMPAATPNILLVMFDQLAPQFLPFYGHPLVQAPAMAALAEDGVVFDNAYCNSPLCAPSRFSMLSGQYCSRIGAYDNAAEFSSDIPTIAHYLRKLGYRTCLAGKMHFVGPDQLHGFEERVTTDMYPADYGWTPDWEHPERRFFWHHNMQSVVEAGVYERTLALDFDSEVAFQSQRKIFDMARDDDPRPFFLTVSFMQPHDPYMTPRAYWQRYAHDDIDMPRVPALGGDEHSRRLFKACAMDEYRIGDEHVRNARHAYYGMIAYLDDQLASLRETMDAAGFGDDTLWIMTADHGDMLGEHGLWYKMHFFEHSLRVPLVITGPRIGPRRVKENVSLVDLLPTLLDYAGDGAPPELAAPVDGRSLLPALSGNGDGGANTVVAEYLAEGTAAPMLMIKRDSYKYTCCAGDEVQLFDLAADPHESENLAGKVEHASVEAALRARAGGHWNSEELTRTVIASQKRRRFTHDALQLGEIRPWDFQPYRDAARQYNRNLAGEMYDTDRRARIPYRDPPDPDGGDGS
jgi:choline-sulfatase